VIFTWGEGGFHNVFDDKPMKWGPPKKRKNKTIKTIKTFVFWDTPQQIK
jgi:hypothetical protein